MVRQVWASSLEPDQTSQNTCPHCLPFTQLLLQISTCCEIVLSNFRTSMEKKLSYAIWIGSWFYAQVNKVKSNQGLWEIAWRRIEQLVPAWQTANFMVVLSHWSMTNYNRSSVTFASYDWWAERNFRVDLLGTYLKIQFLVIYCFSLFILIGKLIFFLFLVKNMLWVGTHWNCLSDVIPISTQYMFSLRNNNNIDQQGL